MGLQEAYNAEVEAIRTGQLSHDDYARCGCSGGWFLTDFDTWEECPAHRGQRHPEDPIPVLRVDVENLDGTPYKGVIACQMDGTPITNDGPLFEIEENAPADLEEAKRVARGWRKALDGAQPSKDVKVRLHREWL